MPRRDTDINVWDELHRRRHALGPFYIAVLVAVAGIASRGLKWGEVAVLATAFGVAGVVRINHRVRKAWRRAYSLAVLIGMIAWVAAMRWFVPEPIPWSTAGVALLAGTLLGGIPWWTSEVRLTQVRMEQQVRNWPRLARRIGRPGLAMTGTVGTRFGFRGRLTWPRGLYAVKDILGAAEAIEGALGAQAGSLRLAPDGRSTHTVVWELVERDPHALPQDWRLPERVGRASDPLELGPFENGEIASVTRYVKGRGVRSMLLVGAPESGKSGLVNLAVATNVCTDDVWTAGLDFKGGAELGPWRDALGFCTSTLSSAWEFLHALAAPGGVLDERGAILAETGLRSWDTDIHGPILDIVVDEAREFLGNAPPKVVDEFVSVANKGRALGVRFVLATQYPTLEALGSSQIRAAVRQRFVFRMESDSGEGYVVTGRVRAEKIPADRPGTCYFQDGDMLYSRPVRIYWLDDGTVRATVEVRRGRTAELDERTEAAITRLFPAFAERERWVGEREAEAIERELAAEADGNAGNDNGNDDGKAADVIENGDMDMGAVLAQRRERLTPEQREAEDRDREAALAESGNADSGDGNGPDPVQAMLRALAAAGDEGLAPKALQEAANRSSSWFYPKAEALAQEGLMRRTRRATWVMPEARRGEYLAIVR